MENPGCVTFNELYIFRSKVTDAAKERRAETMLHEMAHMWFGDLVTMRWWDDVWLNESFATYVVCSVDGAGHAVRGRVGDVRRQREDVGLPAGPAAHDAPITADMPDTESIRLNFDGITYAKGASVLKQLVAWVERTRSCRGSATTSAATSTGTRAWPISSRPSKRPRGATWARGRGVAAGRGGEHPSRSSPRPARTARQRVPHRAAVAATTGRPCARTGWRSGCTTSRTDGSCGARRTELDVSGRVTEVQGCPGRRSPTWCW